MRRAFAVVSLVSLAALAAAGALASVEACSSDDGALNPQPIHDAAPPNDALARDACGTAGCLGDDAGIDSGFAEDGAFVSSGCVVDTDCTDGGRCGYATLAGCAATGLCVTPDVPVADGAPLLACGCDGLNVSYVTDDTTSAPASSLTPCVDAGSSDDGGDLGDAATDAPAD